MTLQEQKEVVEAALEGKAEMYDDGKWVEVPMWHRFCFCSTRYRVRPVPREIWIPYFGPGLCPIGKVKAHTTMFPSRQEAMDWLSAETKGEATILHFKQVID